MTVAAMRSLIVGQFKASIDWAEALEINQRWLATVVHASLADRQAAEDVLQEVALAAIRQNLSRADEKWSPANMPNGSAQVWSFQGESGNLKKDIDELKSELADLKKMIKKLVGKK